MEILLLVALGIAALFFIVRKLNSEPTFGPHPLDSLAKIDSPVVDVVVNNKTGDVVAVSPVIKRKRKVNSQITDAVTQTAPVKKPRKPRVTESTKSAKTTTKKPVKAVAIPVAKKTPGRKPKSLVV